MIFFFQCCIRGVCGLARGMGVREWESMKGEMENVMAHSRPVCQWVEVVGQQVTLGVQIDQ